MQIRYNAIRSIVQTSRISTFLHFALFFFFFLLTLNTVALVEILYRLLIGNCEILSESWFFKFLRFACRNLSCINIKKSCRTLTRLNYVIDTTRVKLKFLYHFLSLTVHHIVLRTVGRLG